MSSRKSMFTKKARVISVSDTAVRIKLDRALMCSCCRFSAVCGKKDEFMITNNSRLPLRVDDTVEVGIDQKKSLFASLIVFFAPCIVFLLSLLFFKSKPEYISFFYALCAVVVYYLVAKWFLRAKEHFFDITLIRKVNE